MSFNISALFERVADTVPDRIAVHAPARSLSYAELDARANRLAHHLRSAGVQRGDHIGLQLLNGTEYLEAMLAAFKLSAVPVNVNYRYVERELEHLYDDADLSVLLHHRQFTPVVGEVLHRTPRIRHLIVVEDGSDAALLDGSIDYEEALAAAPADRDWSGRADDDLYITYTGGTTGLPKGVVWRHDDLFFAAFGGGDPMKDKGPIGDPDELPGRVSESPLVLLLAPPLMHVSGHWGAFNGFLVGWTIVLASPGRFDAAEIWDLVARHGVNSLIVVGDAMARPLLDGLDPSTDTSSLFVFGSGGAILSPSTKERIAAELPGAIVVDTLASSESGTAATRMGSDQRFMVDDRTVVLDDELRRVAPGSGQVGRVARRGHVPLRYHKDEAKSAATFLEFDGHRWVIPGDMATVDDDGSIELLGRGSGCINTGGEKVFPEEVEAVMKGHPDVVDVLVVGVPDEQFGSKVAAVVQVRPGAELDLGTLQAHAREGLAGYKVPRMLCLVDEVRRGPNGKPDYPWAQAHARDLAAAGSDS
jgi:acyl-CoA synthetase (AMP-forming)/AMP-acid ligase II